MAAIVAVLNREGAEGAGNLSRVSAIEVPNLMPRPEFVVDARAERAAEANAAATATAVAAAEVALSVQATIEASATAAAVTQQAAAQATAAAATAVAVSATTDDDSASSATALNAASATPAKNRVSPLLIAITMILGILLGFTIWRNQKEPFVLKAKPERLS